MKTVLVLFVMHVKTFHKMYFSKKCQISVVEDNQQPTVRPIEKPVCSPVQMREILENRPENYRVLFQVLALTGARTGEVLGLQWKHVDLEKAQLRIEQSLWHGLLVAPKTRESVRIINRSVVLLEALGG